MSKKGKKVKKRGQKYSLAFLKLFGGRLNKGSNLNPFNHIRAKEILENRKTFDSFTRIRDCIKKSFLIKTIIIFMVRKKPTPS